MEKNKVKVMITEKNTYVLDANIAFCNHKWSVHNLQHEYRMVRSLSLLD